MGEASCEPTLQWHLVGKVDNLKSRPSRRLYTSSDVPLALFHLPPDRFYLCNANCPHARGPLDQGDIEDIGGKVKVTCPLHFYSFDLDTGESSTGLQLKTYRSEVRGDSLYVLSPEPVALSKDALTPVEK